MNFKQFLSKNKNFLISFIILIPGILVATGVMFGYYFAFLNKEVAELLRSGHSINISTPHWVNFLALIIAAILAYFVKRPKIAIIITVSVIVVSLIAMASLIPLVTSLNH